MKVNVMPAGVPLRSSYTLNEVSAVELIELHQGKPVVGTGVIAYLRQSDGDGPGLVRELELSYHLGRKSWMVCIGHSIQKADEQLYGTLRESVALFEKLTECELPDIKVIDLGIGIYSAKTQYQADNPYALRDGMFYAVRNKIGVRKTFVADVENGRTRISFVGANGHPSETFDPAVVLSAEEWRSLTQID